MVRTGPRIDDDFGGKARYLAREDQVTITRLHGSEDFRYSMFNRKGEDNGQTVDGVERFGQNYGTFKELEEAVEGLLRGRENNPRRRLLLKNPNLEGLTKEERESIEGKISLAKNS